MKRWKKEQQKKLKCSTTAHLSRAMKSTSGLIATAGNGRTDVLPCWCLCCFSSDLRWRSKFVFKWAGKINVSPHPCLWSWPFGHYWAWGFVRAASYRFDPELAPRSQSIGVCSLLIALPCREGFTLGTAYWFSLNRNRYLPLAGRVSWLKRATVLFIRPVLG